jgi:hypothetical protein
MTRLTLVTPKKSCRRCVRDRAGSVYCRCNIRVYLIDPVAIRCGKRGNMKLIGVLHRDANPEHVQGTLRNSC